jgi:phospholipid/cholesterol/gamma-HCH transport system substrate-binding protein
VKPFREMNPVVIGTLGIGLIVGGLAVSFQTDKLPVIGYRDIYKADFTEAAGLQPADEVRVAGIKVGKVTDIDLEGDRVRVTMRLRDVEVGDRSRADIKIKTVLGRKYVQLTPEGSGDLGPDDVIPTSRTTSPFDVAPAFQGLAETVSDIDTAQLAQSFSTLADTFRDTPDEVRASLDGLSRLSTTIASRDAQLKQLLARARGVTDVLAQRDEDLVSFLADTNLVLDEVRKRRAVIDQLLTSTTALADQLTALVRENRATL